MGLLYILYSNDYWRNHHKSSSVQDGAPFEPVLNSMVYGRYNELVFMGVIMVYNLYKHNFIKSYKQKMMNNFIMGVSYALKFPMVYITYNWGGPSWYRCRKWWSLQTKSFPRSTGKFLVSQRRPRRSSIRPEGPTVGVSYGYQIDP